MSHLPSDQASVQGARTKRDGQLLTVQLSNGARVVCVLDMASDVVVVTVAAFAGFRDEAQDEEGFAHLVEHVLCAESIDDQHFWVGRTMEDCVVLRAVIFPHQLDDAIADLANRLQRHTTEEVIGHQQAVIADELRILTHGTTGQPRLPELTAELLFKAAGTPSPPYGQSAPGLAPDRIARFQEKHYTRGELAIVVRGPLAVETVANAVLRFIPPLSPPITPVVPGWPGPGLPDRVIVRVAAQEAAACLGLLVPIDDDLARIAAMSVLADLAGHIRTPGLSHPVARFGAFGPALALRRPGSFTLAARTDPVQGDEEICAAFLRFLDHIAAGRVDREQVSLTARRRAAATRQALDSAWDGPLFFAVAELTSGGAEAAASYAGLLDRVDRAALAVTARELVNHPMTVVVAGAHAH